MGFRRMPATAVNQIAKAIDADSAYREFVAGDLDASHRPSVLWLTRPPGWEQELDALVRAEERRASAVALASDEDDELEEEANRDREHGALTNRIAELEAEVAELSAALTEARTGRRDAQLRAEEAERRAADLGDQRSEAVRQLKDQERVTARQVEQRRQVEDQLAAGLAALPPDPALAEQRDRVQALVDEAAAKLAEIPHLLAALRTAAAEVDDHLSEAQRAGAPSEPAPTAPAKSGVAPAPNAARPNRAASPGQDRRIPQSLPGGVWNDSDEAVRHLLAVADLTVLVDGYNVSKRRWSSLELELQRRRLGTALAALAARTGRAVVLVWDGADVDGSRERAPQGVTVRYTAADQEADDWIIDFCRETPPDQPVLVVSSDKRVQEGASRYGANWCSVDPLLDELAR